MRAALVRYEKRDERGSSTSLSGFAARALARAKPFSGVSSRGMIPLAFRSMSSSGDEDGDQIQTKNKDQVPGSVENKENQASAV